MPAFAFRSARGRVSGTVLALLAASFVPPARAQAEAPPEVRNSALDGQLFYQDEIVPTSTLLGFMNADHWAIALPIARAHPWIGGLFVNHNDYPREALLEAILRFVEEDLAASSP